MQDKLCGRCSASILCRADDIVNCDCNKLVLEKATTDFLTKTQYNCLCNGCLIEIQALVAKAARMNPPRFGEPLVENLHFYKENGLWVFTELYHILKGRCCGNGCRHCAYGFSES